MAKSKKYKTIKASLIEQLVKKGANVAHFTNLVEDYMSYFELKEKLLKDIRTKGTTYKAISSTGKEYEKDNPALKLLPQYTRQMLSILKELGLTTTDLNEYIDESEDAYL